jgi:NADPH:quinone reductase-like Zn-dependent oxidoreductase
VGGLVLVPASLDTVTAMAVAQPGCCALISIEASALQAGETILIHGAAGSIGSLVVRLAKHRGARVIATCRSTARDLVMNLGADEVICFDEEDPFSCIDPVDVVFDPLGGDIHRRSYTVLKRGGRLVYLTAEPIVDLSATYGVTTTRAKIEDKPETLRAVLTLAAAGILRPLPPRTFPFERCADVHRLLEAGQQGPGRVILTMT